MNDDTIPTNPSQDDAPHGDTPPDAAFPETTYDDYVHGLLPDRAERLERLCETDESARTALAAARERAEALRSLPPVEAPETLVRSTLDRIAGRETRRAGYRRWFLGIVGSVTVASLLLVAGSHLYYASLKASPYDVRLLGQRELLAGSRASVRLAVWNEETNRPLAGVTVRLALYDKGRGGHVEAFDLGETTTDERGIAQPVFDLPDWASRAYELRVVAATGRGDEVLVESVQLVRSSKLMLSTDKPIYKPGQTIHVRALSLRRPDLKPVAGEKATFAISDPKGNVVFKRTTETSEFGITSADCPLATEILEGPYTIDCTIGDTTSSVTVAVEQYVLPKFALDVALDQPFYAPGDRVRATLHAGYFFGQPVAGAEVTLIAETEAAGTRRIHESTATTDAAGDASVEFDLPAEFVGLERNSGDASFRLVAEVRDTAGQQQATAVTRIVTAQPIRIEVVPEMGRLVAGVPNKIYLFTNWADGRPARTRTNIAGFEEPIDTSNLGVAAFELTPGEQEMRLTITATSTDGADRIGRRHVVLETERGARDFVLRTDRAVYTGGEPMTVTILGGGVEPVFLDFLKDGQTVLTRTIDVGGVRANGTATFDLPPELFGTLQLCAYRFGEQGLPVVKLRTVQVNRAGELTIAAKLDRETYRPGEEAKVEFTLTDADGKPVPGALSLAAVDEAVFHVLKQRPGLEGTFFELERELLAPVYAIYGGWSPGDAGALPVAERIEFEQALFARTTQIAAEVPFNGKRFDEPAEFDPGFDAIEPDFGDPAAFDGAGAAMFEEDAVDVAFQVDAASPLTLAVTSYPAKRTAVLERQRQGLRGVRAGWQWFVAWLVVAALAIFAVFLFKAFLITLGVLAGGGVLLVLVVSLVTGEPFASVGSKVMTGEAMAGAEMFWDDAGGTESIEAFSAELQLILDPQAQPVRVRRSFPETLLWRPELVTDDSGRATLTVPLADSITTWRMTASAVSGDGRLGALEGIRVFQPFFVDLDLPVALVRNDEVAVPVVVYNYLDQPQTVELELAHADWFELLDEAAEGEGLFQRLELAPGEVRSTHYRLRAENVGTHRLQVTAWANGIADALDREIAVVPDGRAVETVVNGALDEPATVDLVVPDDAIPGSVTAIVKLYPSGFSQLVEGLDGIFQKPSGCFEQTSSTTYPNVLALRYLRESGQAVPEVEAKARQYVHLGYQKLLGFEIDGGGFDWFGNPPANLTLTAYGLLEFEDMAKVHDVDPRLIERTRGWLLSKRELDGAWKADRGMLNDGLADSVQRGADLDLSTTAYVAWALYRHGETGSGRETLDFLLAHRPETIDDPYTLALVVNALVAIDPDGHAADPYVARLLSLRKNSEDGKQAWWELAADRRTNFYGDGDSGTVEVTALAALALLKTKSNPAVVAAALTWLVDQKGSNGTWPSTQATVLALQALVGGTTAPLGGDVERSFRLLVDGEAVKEWTVPADQAEVMQQVNVPEHVAAGTHSLRIEETSRTGTGYQVAFRYHVPETTPDPAATPEPLSIDLTFDRTDLAVSDTIVATARVRNNGAAEAPMVIVDLPIPAGFRLDPIDLEELVASGDVAKYQVNARTAVIYLRGLAAGGTLELKYRLEATMPVKLTVPPATVYEYYTPSRRGRGKSLEIVVGPTV